MGKAAITTWAKRSIDRVMTSEPRPYRAILDDLFLLSKKQLTYRNRSASRSYDIINQSIQKKPQHLIIIGRNKYDL